MQEIDILLVNVGGTKKRVYQDLNKDYSAIEPPFWAALTAGFIRKKGFSVDIIDANAENLTYEETAEIIEQKNPKFVNIIVYGQHPSASTQLMVGVGKLCEEIKKKEPNRKIILTGLHPSALPERTIKEENCDYVCEGEGFYTLLGLLENKNLNEILGLWYRDANEIKSNSRAPLIQNLDSELDEVAWDLLPMGKYKAHNWHCLSDLESRPRYASLSTSLGCPFNCIFCCINAPFGGPSYRLWSPEWVLKQIDILVKRYGVKNLKIIDELFILNPEHFIKIAEGIIQMRYDLNIWAYARVDTVKEEYLKKLKQAGFNWFAIGIESASENIRRGAAKGNFKQIDIENIIKKVKNAGINIIGNYIFGLPEDDFQTMQETLDLAIKLNCEFANFYCAMAYPGSKLYNLAKQEGYFLPENEGGPGWIGYSQHAYETLPLPTKTLSAIEVLKFRDAAFIKYFTNPEYLDMIEGKFGLVARKHIEEMTKIRLKRKLLENNQDRKMLTKQDLIAFEDKISQLWKEAKIKAPIHLSKGNEEQLIEIFKEIGDDDWVFSNYRSHYHALLKGIPSDWLENEIIKGNSIHIMSKEHKFYTSSIVPGHLPIALGTALALKIKNSKNRVWAFCGDMASETGVFYEATKYAEGHNLPITFIVEDDGLSVYTPTRDVWGTSAFATKVETNQINKYNFPQTQLLRRASDSKPLIKRYSYKRGWPHHSIGIWIDFPEEKKLGDLSKKWPDYADELKRAMEMLAHDKRVLFIGQTVGYKGSPIYRSVQDIPKEKRIELPIMEELQMGISIGLALEGFVPVSIYPRFDFLTLATNQLVNHLDKAKEISHGEFNPKVIIRTTVGSREPLYPGPQHCQDHTLAYKSMLTNIYVKKLVNVEEIIPEYKAALERDSPSLLIEVMDLYHN